MKHVLRNLLLLLTVFSMTGLILGVGGASAKDITMAIGLALPPYNLPDTNSGMEFEIVKEALALKGHNLTPKYVPFGRVRVEVENRSVDGAFPINEQSGLEVFYSDEHITYENVVITLEKNHLTIATVEDLQSRSVAAFQDATIYLGETYAAMAKANAQYKEIPNQELQINLLYAGRVETVVSDINIFYYYRQRVTQVDTTQPIVIHRIFPPTPYKVAFRDETVRNDFNAGLQQLRESGRYDAIIKQYIGQ